jgi:hypothetical protein
MRPLWHLHPNVAAACRNDDDRVMLAIGLPRSQLRGLRPTRWAPSAGPGSCRHGEPRCPRPRPAAPGRPGFRLGRAPGAGLKLITPRARPLLRWVGERCAPCHPTSL